jgi:hypothetical protein|nr:MAG TPA: hypothetical protein [Caudoviricetes sp.]
MTQKRFSPSLSLDNQKRSMKMKQQINPIEAIIRIALTIIGMLMIISEGESLVPNVIGAAIVMFMIYINGWIPIFEDAK